MSAQPLADPGFLRSLAEEIGTPFLFYDADVLRARIALIRELVAAPSLAVRYAMKACSAHLVLREMARSGVWIDAVSGNEVLRAKRAGFAMGAEPPVVLLTADVLRDNALTVVLEHGVMPNIGSPAMIDELRGAGYGGPIAVRVNPGFGHGHVQSCDTGGPSSKHGIWHQALAALRARAEAAKLPIVELHTHLGTGPQIREFDENLRRFVEMVAATLPDYPDVEAVNLGGGIPHPYRPGAAPYDLGPFRKLLL